MPKKASELSKEELVEMLEELRAQFYNSIAFPEDFDISEVHELLEKTRVENDLI